MFKRTPRNVCLIPESAPGAVPVPVPVRIYTLPVPWTIFPESLIKTHPRDNPFWSIDQLSIHQHQIHVLSEELKPTRTLQLKPLLPTRAARLQCPVETVVLCMGSLNICWIRREMESWFLGVAIQWREHYVSLTEFTYYI